MLFNSLEFFAFLAVVYGLYRICQHRWQNRVLLIASYFFYGAWDWRFLSLIFLSTVVDYTIGLRMHRESQPSIRKRLLLVSLVTNLGLLGVFKYFNFFTDSLESLLGSAGISLGWLDLNVILPVGISFYTFQTLSYTVDVFRGHLKPARNFLDFALFVSFFPQLVAGPIERASRLLPQVENPRTIQFQESARGAFLILLGLFKKIAVADGVAQIVDSVFNTTASVSTLEVIVATYCFAIQIYCDFSGYSDIARGISKLFGFDLMVNFKNPFFAVNPKDFWQRWHISLSSWLRDYLYIPLGGNRQGTANTYRNLMLTMGLGGLWHGAAWNFVWWGVYQGAILCVHRAIAGPKPQIRPTKTFIDLLRRVLLTVAFFQIVAYGWLLFRANSLEQVFAFTDLLFFHPNGIDLSVIYRPSFVILLGIPLLLALEFAQFALDRAKFYARWPLPVQSLVYAALIFTTLMGLSNAQDSFIYFQF